MKTYLRSVKNGSNLSGTKRKTHVSRMSSSNGVHGKTTSFVGGSGKSGLGVTVHSGAHLKSNVLADASTWGAESIDTGGSNGHSSKCER